MRNHLKIRSLALAASLGSLLVSATAAMPASQPERTGRRCWTEPLTLSYVANEGVMLAFGETKILIDALFDRPHPDYRAPSPEVLSDIMKGAAPFDGVDLLLVTHNHPDHFDAGLAERYLEAFPSCRMIAPADAAAALRKASAAWDKLESRVVSIDLKLGEKTTRTVQGVPVTAFRTLHSGELETPMNLMYLFELGGRRVFHEGDSAFHLDGFRGFGLGAEPVDLALVHYWFPLDPGAARFLQEVLKPDHIALVHRPLRLEGDAPGKIDQVRKYYKDIFLLLPGMAPREF
jgi:L-ascorbate metabolism protein UlaG (beta-lactamase superfamily)